MREIKFRAWDLYNKRMLDIGDLVTISVKPDLDFANYEVMQFTGLKDKNGKEIYEGDVVHCRDKRHLVVVSRACFVLKEIIVDNHIRISMQDEYQMEIIGNLYENPELLQADVTKQ